ERMSSDSDLERRALDIMEDVMDLADDAQARALDEHCQGDEQLRRRVEALLATDREGTTGLGHELARGTQARTYPETVGPYRLVRQLGEGGMGTVYLARRADGAYDAQVAVKFVRAGHSAATRQFSIERQILAGLKHPSIAQLLDGGEEDG